MRESFALVFVAPIEVDEHQPWDILWTDEANFYINSDVNIYNCRIRAKKISDIIYLVTLHSLKVTFWCGMKANLKIGRFLLEEQKAA